MANAAGTDMTCSICSYLNDLPSERILWEDEYWICGPLLDVPGWTMVMTRRHAEGIWSLSDAEASRFGPLMRDIAQTVKAVTGAQRVHFAAMGEVAPHYHNAILPRRPGEQPVWDSMALVTRAAADADPHAASHIEKALRAQLGAMASGGNRLRQTAGCSGVGQS